MWLFKEYKTPEKNKNKIFFLFFFFVVFDYLRTFILRPGPEVYTEIH